MLLTKGLKEVEYLDVGIKASGKLQLLEAMLLEIKKQELKVLIIFQVHFVLTKGFATNCIQLYYAFFGLDILQRMMLK